MRRRNPRRSEGERVAKRAVYPGMFDPLHNGHVDVIQRSLAIFDEVIVAVVANPSKQPLFTVEQRLEMIDEATTNLGVGPHLRIVSFDGLLIDLVARERADCIVRGIRAVSDFEYEFQMALMNRKLRSTVETVFLMPHEKYTYISSRLIKEVASFGTSVTGMVPPIVEKRLAEKSPPKYRGGPPPKEPHTVLAERVKTLAPSSTLAVQAKAKALRARGVDVISFGAGEPDFDTPERIKAAAVEAMRRGQTKYTDVAGVPELRAAVCAKLKRDHGLAYEPDDVLVSCGAKHTLFNMAVAVLDPGDEVLIPSPYWVSYPEQARLVRGMPVEVPTREATGFDLDPERLAAAVTPRTKAIVLNSPNNPTGAVFSAEALGNVARLAVDAGLLVVSDECYEALTFEGRHVSIASLGPEIKAMET